MPIYEYRCETCSGKFEVLTTFAEREGQACPKCHSTQTRVLVSTFGLAPGENLAADFGSGGCCGGGCGSCGTPN